MSSATWVTTACTSVRAAGRAFASNGDPGFESLDLALPDLGATDDDGEGLEESSHDDLTLSEADGDPFDDQPAHDLPLDVAIDVAEGEPSALDDDELGVGSDPDQSVPLDDRDGSLLDDRGHAEEGLEHIGDDELGLDPIPREADDGGLEGLEDPSADSVEDDFPPLDGDADDDDDELELGILLPE